MMIGVPEVAMRVIVGITRAEGGEVVVVIRVATGTRQADSEVGQEGKILMSMNW
jgi:hypothetical protein